MRSIRRSMTVYMLLLLAATLAVVWVVIDQVTARALAAREAAGADKINASYLERCRNERERVDQALLHQARFLGNEMQHYYENGVFNIEVVKFRVATATSSLLFGVDPLATWAWTNAVNHQVPWGRPNPGPGALARLYFSTLPLPEEYIQHVADEEANSDFFQLNQGGREWRSKSLAGRSLPFDYKEFDSKSGDPNKLGDGTNLIDWTYRDSTLGTDRVKVRRVLYKAPFLTSSRSRRAGGGFGPPPPRSLLGTWAATGGGPPTPPAPVTDSLPRLYIQCAAAGADRRRHCQVRRRARRGTG